MNNKRTAVNMRVDENMLKDIDNYAKKNGLSRSKAINSLADIGFKKLIEQYEKETEMLGNTEQTNFIEFKKPEKEKILNLKNSSMKVIEEDVLYHEKLYITLRKAEEIMGATIPIDHHIKHLDGKDKLRCDEPSIYRVRGSNKYIYLITREGCLEMLKRLTLKSLTYDKQTAKRKINAYFDSVEEDLKPTTRYKIDILIDSEKSVGCYSDSPDPHKILKKLYENETVKNSLISGKGFDLHVEPDNTFVQRLKV